MGSGTLSGNNTRNTGAGGLAGFNNLSIDIAGQKRLRFTSSGLDSDTSNVFTVSSGAPARLAFVQQPGNGYAGVIISPAVTIQLRDTLGNDVALAGDTISIALSGGSGSISGTLNRATKRFGSCGL